MNKPIILNDVQNLLDNDNPELMTPLLYSALVGYFLDWPLAAILTNLPSLSLAVLVQYIKKRQLPPCRVYRIFYSESQLTNLKKQMKTRSST